MLRYLNSGPRPFGDFPMPPHRRLNWEFYAVLSGRLAPLLDGISPVLASDTLWLFPPESTHGWIGQPGSSCEIVVFHFSALPAELERWVRQMGYAAVALSNEDKQRLLALVAELDSHHKRPGPFSEYHFNRALLDLCLLVLDQSEGRVAAGSSHPLVLPAASSEPATSAVAKVLIAENWFRNHLAEQPTLSDVARVCCLSTGHLRRLFVSVRRQSPKEAFNKIRMEHALQLLAFSDLKLEAVATECGFAGASQFCQAFKQLQGTTPAAWRKNPYSPYQHPLIRAVGQGN